MPRDQYDDHEYDPGFEPRPRRRPPRRGNTLLWVFGGFGCLGLLVCGGLVGLVVYAFSPTGFPEQTEDYADARKGFKTVLTTAGPSPQVEGPVEPPAGVQVVTYQSGDLKLTAWASEPPADGTKQPGVLYLHSGFGFGPEDWKETEPLRAAGFAVVVPILRGENGQPGSYTLFCDEVGDCLAAGELLAKRPGVDKDRLFLAGYSAGGTLAMLTAMADGRYKGCAAVSGSPDLHAFVSGKPDREVPFDRTVEREIAVRSPLAWPNSFKCPARLYVGEDEFPLTWHTHELGKKARAAGRDVVVEELPGNHDTVIGPAVGRMVGFFQSLR